MTDASPLSHDNLPENLLEDFEAQSQHLDQRLDQLRRMIEDLREELQGNSRSSLSRLANVARDMAAGRVYQKIDLEAKGELGALVESLNQTLLNLQQLDASVKQQTTQVPELAAQLDAITSETERATQDVMNRLDAMMAHTEDAGDLLKKLVPAIQAHEAQRAEMAKTVNGFLDRAAKGEDSVVLAQEVLEYLFALQLNPADTLDLSPAVQKMQGINDEAFEILNLLQFQDITRQKIEKVVMLLKNFQSGLQRLLVIFNIVPAAADSQIFEDRKVATQENIFKTSLEADSSKASVEDIIAQFKKNQG
jgi:chemotaxis regulatin CheY-phosphate phosphatase CheZ